MALPNMPALPVKFPNPVHHFFGGIGKIFGSRPPAWTGPFTDEKSRGMSTDRVRWDPEANAWRFTDPAIGEDFTFTQDRAGNLILSDGRVIPYGFGSTGSRDRQFPEGDIRWNIYNEEKKLEVGGGPDSEFSQYWRGDPRYTGGKTLRNWQDYVLSSGPFYNPVVPSTPEPSQQAQALPPVPQVPAVPSFPDPPPPDFPTMPVPPAPQAPSPAQPLSPQADPRVWTSGLLGNAARNTRR